MAEPSEIGSLTMLGVEGVLAIALKDE